MVALLPPLPTSAPILAFAREKKKDNNNKFSKK
jgi:hypothetical protein